MIRSFEAKDFEACYAISLATGLAGGDASLLYRDPRLMGHIYIAPYALLEPTLTFVVEDRDGVAGFVAGIGDTATWEDRLERDWWPALRKTYADVSGEPSSSLTPDQRRIRMIHRPARTPATVIARYPAHLHMNLLPRLHRRGIGSRLFQTWHAAVTRRGATTFHVGVNRENAKAVPFWRSLAFKELIHDDVPEGGTFWMGRDN